MKRNIIIFLLVLISAQAFPKDIVTYPKTVTNGDIRYDFQWKILKEALESTKLDYGEYELVTSTIGLPEVRHEKELLAGKKINIIRGITSREFEDEFISIKIPIQKGILGYRVFLINKSKSDIFNDILNIDDLKKLTVGQGEGWADVKILKHNGFKVTESHNYEGLFLMLVNNRFDLFSRAITEAPIELSTRKDVMPNLFLDQKNCIYYPFAEYFFFNKKDVVLAKRIKTGMLRLIESGKYDILFDEKFGEIIRSVNLNTRNIYNLINPFLPETAPLENKKYWVDITKYN